MRLSSACTFSGQNKNRLKSNTYKSSILTKKFFAKNIKIPLFVHNPSIFCSDQVLNGATFAFPFTFPSNTASTLCVAAQ
jgi:hypothetical protein